MHVFIIMIGKFPLLLLHASCMHVFFVMADLEKLMLINQFLHI